MAVDLSWTASPDDPAFNPGTPNPIMDYWIYRSETPDFLPPNDVPINIVPSGQTAYQDTTASQGTTYYYQVVAVDTSSNPGEASVEVSGTTLEPDLEAPGQVTLISSPGNLTCGSISRVRQIQVASFWTEKSRASRDVGVTDKHISGSTIGCRAALVSNQRPK